MRYALSLIVTLVIGCGSIQSSRETKSQANRSASAKEHYMRVAPPVTPPVPIHRVEPAYPMEYRQNHVTGHVVLEVAVSDRGTVDHVGVRQSLTPRLDQAASDAVLQWTFEPATLHAKPVPVLFNMTIAFKSMEDAR